MHVLVNLVSDLRESFASHTYSKIEKVSIRRQNQEQLSEALPFLSVQYKCIPRFPRRNKGSNLLKGPKRQEDRRQAHGSPNSVIQPFDYLETYPFPCCTLISGPVSFCVVLSGEFCYQDGLCPRAKSAREGEREKKTQRREGERASREVLLKRALQPQEFPGKVVPHSSRFFVHLYNSPALLLTKALPHSSYFE